MADIPKEDLERIEKRLESIEAKIGSRWMLPIAVVLISGFIGIATVWVQVHLERTSSEKRMSLERSFQEEAAERNAHQVFYNDAVTSVGRIQGLFKQACYDPNFKKGDSLNDLSIDCFALIDKHGPHYGEQKEFIKKMRAYDDLVSDKLFTFGSRTITDHERKEAFEEARQRYDEVRKSLEEFYAQYVKEHPSSRP